jgi:hypothetical protein
MKNGRVPGEQSGGRSSASSAISLDGGGRIVRARNSESHVKRSGLLATAPGAPDTAEIAEAL